MADFLGQFTMQQLVVGAFSIGLFIGMVVGGIIGMVAMMSAVDKKLDAEDWASAARAKNDRTFG